LEDVELCRTERAVAGTKSNLGRVTTATRDSTRTRRRVDLDGDGGLGWTGHMADKKWLPVE